MTTPTRLIVGFAGRIGAGKTTAAQELNKYGFTRVRFAGAFKKMMAALGLTPEEIDGNLKELPCELLCGSSPRWAMQSIGHQWGRELIGPEIWVNAWKRSVNKMPAGAHVVADDVRYANEAGAIHSMGGVVIRIDHILTNNKSAHELHESERLEFDVDDTIVNDFTPGFKDHIRTLAAGLATGLVVPEIKQAA
jgi:hypothetical protein